MTWGHSFIFFADNDLSEEAEKDIVNIVGYPLKNAYIFVDSDLRCRPGHYRDAIWDPEIAGDKKFWWSGERDRRSRSTKRGVLERIAGMGLSLDKSTHKLVAIRAHGDGFGIEIDANTYLTLPELREQLQKAVSKAKNSLGKARGPNNVRLSVLGFDTCLMGNIETAFELLDVADYVVASQTLEPVAGWRYEKILREADKLPDSPRGLALHIAEAQRDCCGDPAWAGRPEKQTTAAIDVSKAAGVAEAVNDLGDKLAENWKKVEQAVRRARDNAAEFGKGDYVDIYDFADELMSALSRMSRDPGIRKIIKQAENLQRKVEKCVVDGDVRKHPDNTDEDDVKWAHGLSAWFPSDQETYCGAPDEAPCNREDYVQFRFAKRERGRGPSGWVRLLDLCLGKVRHQKRAS